MPGLFITGTDTGVGKTLATTALLRAMATLELRVVGMKPIAAGAERVDSEWINEDVALLVQASNVPAPRELVNPYLFREPLAPHIAADRKGVHIEIPLVVDRYRQLAGLADWVLVEGVGGFRVPLDDRKDTADLAAALALPVLMVVGMRLGCLNHALLTAEAIERRGLRLAGWIASRIDPEMAAFDENLAGLERRLAAPCLAVFPWLEADRPQRASRLLPSRRLERWLAETARKST
jgi:dethiobiotin synthetase